MLDAAPEAIKFARGRSRRDLETDRMFALALVKCIEIVGEAAAAVSEDFQRNSTSIPWADIVGMRHRLVHGYFAVDMDRVWDTVSAEIPSLVVELEKIVASVAEDSCVESHILRLADIVENGGAPRIKMGREFLLGKPAT